MDNFEVQNVRDEPKFGAKCRKFDKNILKVHHVLCKNIPSLVHFCHQKTIPSLVQAFKPLPFVVFYLFCDRWVKDKGIGFTPDTALWLKALPGEVF